MNWGLVVPLLAACISGVFMLLTGRVGRGVKKDTAQAERDRQRDLAKCEEQIQKLQIKHEEQTRTLQHDLLTVKRFVFKLRGQLADAGIRTPELPRLRSEEWDA